MKKQNGDVLISIIIPFYNIGWELLKECIDSILRQDMSYCEVILIDDCSMDRNIAEQYKIYVQEYSNFIILQNAENKGVSYSRNRGIEAAHGKFLLFFDADDWVEEDLLSSLYRIIEAGEVDTIFYEYSRWINGKKIPCFRKLDEQDYQVFNDNMLERMIISNDFNSPCCTLYAKEIIDKENIRFDIYTKLGEDFLFNAQYLQCIKFGKHLNKSYYNYRYNTVSTTNTFSPQKVEDTGKGYFCRKELLKRYNKNGWAYAKLLKKFYSEYYRSIIIHILNGLNSKFENEEVFECLEYEWVKDLVHENHLGLLNEIKRMVIKNRYRNTFIFLSKLQKIEYALKRIKNELFQKI